MKNKIIEKKFEPNCTKRFEPNCTKALCGDSNKSWNIDKSLSQIEFLSTTFIVLRERERERERRGQEPLCFILRCNCILKACLQQIPNSRLTIDLYTHKEMVFLKVGTTSGCILSEFVLSHIFRIKLMCWHYNNRAVNNLNVQMILLRLESWTSQWHHPVRGLGYHVPWRFSLTSWASFHYISTSVVHSMLEWEQSSCDYLLSHANSVWNWLRLLFYSSRNHKNFKYNFSVAGVWTYDLALEIST